MTLTERPGADEEQLIVDLDELTCSRSLLPPIDSVYHMRVANRTMKEFFATAARWEDLLLSLRYSMSRRPDVHVSAITDFLRLEARDLAQYNPTCPTERIVVEYAGRRFEIDRYCPHQNGDLRLATIDGRGVLRCPRHGWEFDLEDGGRCALNRASIFAQPAGVEEEESGPGKSARPGRE